MSGRKTASIVIAAVILGIVRFMLFGGIIGFTIIGLTHSDSDRYLISADGTYVMCDGVKYVALRNAEEVPDDVHFDCIIATNVCREGADFIDNYFIYGYVIYGSAHYPHDGAIYVHTAESYDAVTGFFVREDNFGVI